MDKKQKKQRKQKNNISSLNEKKYHNMLYSVLKNMPKNADDKEFANKLIISSLRVFGKRVCLIYETKKYTSYIKMAYDNTKNFKEFTKYLHDIMLKNAKITMFRINKINVDICMNPYGTCKCKCNRCNMHKNGFIRYIYMKHKMQMFNSLTCAFTNPLIEYKKYINSNPKIISIMRYISIVRLAKHYNIDVFILYNIIMTIEEYINKNHADFNFSSGYI